MKKKTFICCILSASMIFASGSLTSVYAADDTLTLADYPEYKDIVQKYYDGAAAGWNIGQFQEQNLCYLAGYYADINKLGYFLQDIDNNGTAELFIGALDDGSDTYEWKCSLICIPLLTEDFPLSLPAANVTGITYVQTTQ